jgi:hypothetical protein
MRSWKGTEHQILLNIHAFWYVTICHQVNTFPRIVQLSSSVRQIKGAFCCNACPYEEALQSSKTSETTCIMTQFCFSQYSKLHSYNYASFKSGITLSTYITLPIICKNKHGNSKYFYMIL